MTPAALERANLSAGAYAATTRPQQIKEQGERERSRPQDKDDHDRSCVKGISQRSRSGGWVGGARGEVQDRPDENTDNRADGRRDCACYKELHWISEPTRMPCLNSRAGCAIVDEAGSANTIPTLRCDGISGNRNAIAIIKKSQQPPAPHLHGRRLTSFAADHKAQHYIGTLGRYAPPSDNSVSCSHCVNPSEGQPDRGLPAHDGHVAWTAEH
jgi:hypothetical protein